jgi:hypothetical protein
MEEFSKEKHCWKRITSNKTNKFYFLNLETGETQWNFPNTLDPIPKNWKKYISRKTKPMGSYYMNTLSGENTWERPTGIPDIPDKKILPEGWESKKSKCDNVYYINKSENITTWKLPTDSKITDKIRAKEQRGRDKYKLKTYTVEDKLGLAKNPQDAQHHPGWQDYPTAEKRKDQTYEDYKKKLKELEKILADQKEREDTYYEKQRERERERERIREREQKDREQKDRERERERERERDREQKDREQKDREQKDREGKEVVIKVLTYNIAHEISKVIVILSEFKNIVIYLN